MDYPEHDKGASGNIPEFGAIFMSNIQTKKECFQRNIFALPSSHAEFVTCVKEGMVLFMFETRKRELFGVYQASSDGAVDIVPHAFSYSGQRFPAQVRFRQIWHCDPISEKEFQDAIIENYFSARKFNLGLSKDQVRRLLYLFSSRKIKSKMPSQRWSEAMVEVSVKDSKLVGDDRHELSERGYMVPTDYDDHVNPLTRGKEDDVMVDNRANAEGKVYPFPHDDFLAKRRRIGKEGRLATKGLAGNALYGHGYQRAFCTGSPKDSLDEVRTLANAGRFLAFQKENEDQANNIQHPAQSPDHFLDPLDVRAPDYYTSLQRSTLRDDYNNIHNAHQQTFASDNYGSSMVQSKHVIDDDRFLLDDFVRRDCDINVVKSVAISDHDLNLCRQEREIVKDHEWLMERKLENRHHLDSDGNTIGAFDPPANHLRKIRKTTAARRFQIDENEPHFGTCSSEGFSSKTVLRPWHCDYRIIEGRKYPILEGRSTENMVDKVPPTLATNAGYVVDADRQTLDNLRFGKSERVDNREANHTHTNPVMSMKYPCFSKPEQNISSISGKFPEKQLSQFTVSRNFDLSPSIFEDATITRTVPYSPDHPNLSHGCSASKEANQNSTSMQKNHLHDDTLGNFYPLSSNRLQQYPMESENSTRALDTTLEYGDNGFATSTSGLRSSLLRESSNAFVNPDFSMDMDLNTSIPVNYRGSLSSKLSPPCTDPANFEGEKGLLAYYSKSRDHDSAFNGNLPEALENQRKHVPQHGMGMLASKYSSCSESQDLGMGIRLRDSNWPIYENQYFRFSRNMNLRELDRSSGTNSTLNRRSVFTRLSTKSSQFSEEKNDNDVNFHDSYMDATADEVMEMLKQNDNLSPGKPGKSRVVGQSRESGVHERKTQCHMETEYSTMEMKRLNNVTQATADSTDEIPKETRTLDFKRRSERKKILVASEEVKSSTSATSRRKKLVRPAFSKTDTAIDAATRANETLRPPVPILGKDDKQSSETATCFLESEIPNDSTRSINVLTPHTRREMDCIKEPPYLEEQKDAVAHVLPSTSVELGDNERLVGSSEVPRETSQQMISDIETSVEGVLAKDTKATSITSSNLPEPSFAGCRNYLTEAKHPKKMKIILTTKKDVKASSSQ
ncbi:uncharacterized protein LOC131026276 [Salvia miltiorrhiza]|uniref:uncharacterized protein LOC131026276 n=1 Tax=Salvia miltiorrhiza TaxID=226208 RepID=UPI0025ACCB5B|nr:uncharacterized protein LOC131026276 [Salvia miltiorrhiza]XP_057812069.1 uncharacterized protein LOC131026276 [Salvia miltiorrhiza]